MKKCENFIIPQMITTGSYIQQQGETQINKITNCVYIPIDKTLESFLKTDGNLQCILDYKQSLETNRLTNVISNVIQTPYWKEKTFKYANKLVLPLFLYVDDFETGNVLGSHSGIQKFCGVYMNIPLLPPEKKSKLNSIFVSMIINSIDLKELSQKVIFSNLIKDLNNLESNGLNINVNKTNYSIYFVLVSILGDNLGLNSILGYTESFNAQFYAVFAQILLNIAHFH